MLKKMLTALAILALSAVALAMFMLFFGVWEALGSAEVESLPEPHGEHAVGVVDLTGEIYSAADFNRLLNMYLDDSRFKAVIVRIDSPGGAVGAAEEIQRAIQNGQKKKPIVCSLGSVAASGGFYAAMGCRKIVTN